MYKYGVSGQSLSPDRLARLAPFLDLLSPLPAVVRPNGHRISYQLRRATLVSRLMSEGRNSQAEWLNRWNVDAATVHYQGDAICIELDTSNTPKIPTDVGKQLTHAIAASMHSGMRRHYDDASRLQEHYTRVALSVPTTLLRTTRLGITYTVSTVVPRINQHLIELLESACHRTGTAIVQVQIHRSDNSTAHLLPASVISRSHPLRPLAFTALAAAREGRPSHFHYH